jgi:hypothetical protein
MTEKSDKALENITSQRLKFEEKETRSGFFRYIFDNVVIEVDHRDPYFEDVPQLIFATYVGDATQASLNKPSLASEGVDIDYVIKCIKEVVRHTGDTKFWFEPYIQDPDLKSDEDRKRRRQARARLFSRYADIEESPDGEGYIVNFG